MTNLELKFEHQNENKSLVLVVQALKFKAWTSHDFENTFVTTVRLNLTSVDAMIYENLV